MSSSGATVLPGVTSPGLPPQLVNIHVDAMRMLYMLVELENKQQAQARALSTSEQKTFMGARQPSESGTSALTSLRKILMRAHLSGPVKDTPPISRNTQGCANHEVHIVN